MVDGHLNYLDAMSKYIDRDRLDEDYRKYIAEGRDFEFNPDELPSGCIIEYQEDGTPQLRVTDPEVFSRHFSN